MRAPCWRRPRWFIYDRIYISLFNGNDERTLSFRSRSRSRKKSAGNSI